MSRHEEGGGERPAEEAKIVAPRAREETHSAGRVFDFEGSGGEGGGRASRDTWRNLRVLVLN